MTITLREPILDRVRKQQTKEKRSSTAEMIAVLAEEALDRREAKKP